MIRQAFCPGTDALVSFVYDELDGSEGVDRRALARHVESCEPCAAEVAALGGVRRTLREWAAPEMALGFRVAQDPRELPWPRGRLAWLPAWSVPALPLAAAAVLVLGAGLGLARLDVQYDANGLRVRTGWGHAGNAGASAAGLREAAAGAAGSGAVGSGVAGTGAAGMASRTGPAGARPVSTGHLGATAVSSGLETVGVAVPGGNAGIASGSEAWRVELASMERRFRQELAQLRQGDGPKGGQVVATGHLAGDPGVPAGGERISAGDQAFLRRVQQMVDQSEVRQQQNLALRAAELSRAFDLQRRTDLVQIEQGFGRLNQDAEQQRLILNAIRVSQQQPQQ